MGEPISVDVPVRYRDLDTFEHVNNAVYASYVEEARAAYFAEVLEMTVEEYSYVTASLELSFERPVTMGDVVTASAWVTDLGRSSLTMAYELSVEGETVATAETVLVFVDRETRRSSAVADSIRERILEHESLESGE